MPVVAIEKRILHPHVVSVVVFVVQKRTVVDLTTAAPVAANKTALSAVQFVAGSVVDLQ